MEIQDWSFYQPHQPLCISNRGADWCDPCVSGLLFMLDLPQGLTSMTSPKHLIMQWQARLL